MNNDLDVLLTDSLPGILGKASEDQWCYLLETKTGQQFLFSYVHQIDNEWIQLEPVEDFDEDAFIDGPKKNIYVIKERGITIRIDSIAWVADGYS